VAHNNKYYQEVLVHLEMV